MDQDLNLPLERQLVSILGSNREGARGTQRARSGELFRAAREIVAKYGLQKWDNLGQKHVTFLVEKWKLEDTGNRSIEGKLSHMRWLLHKIGKPNLLPRNNAALGIQPGPRCTRAGKIIEDPTLQERLARIAEPEIRALVLLGRELGMRIREASLFRPTRDVNGNQVWIKRGSKGGRPRYLFLHNDKQRQVMVAVRELVGERDALIPRSFETFEKWRQHVYGVLRAAGFSRKADSVFHDLRRTYAVRRLENLLRTRGNDRDAASKLVSKELGHNRIEILEWYVDFESMDSGEAATAA